MPKTTSRRLPGRPALIACLSLMLFSCTGCWGLREPDEMGFILAMGIDKGKSNIINVTFQVAVPKALGGGGEGGGTTEILSVEAASIFGALQLANTFMTRDLTLIHNRMVVVSEEIAREGLNKYINPLIRDREIRRNTFLMVTRETTARKFLEENKSVLEKYPSRQFELFFKSQSYTALIPNSIINEFYECVKTPGRGAITAVCGLAQEKPEQREEKTRIEKIATEMSYLPGNVPRTGGNKIDLIGLAAYQGDRLIGFLDGTETRYLQMVNGEFQSALFTFPDLEKPEEYIIVMEIKKGRAPEIKINLKGERPVIEVNLVLEADIFSIQSGINYERGVKRQQLQHFLEEYISKEALRVITKAQQEFQSDIFGFGDRTRSQFWTWQDWEEYGWAERFPQAEVRVTTSVKIRRTGLISKTVEISRE